MALRLVHTSQFKRDYKRARKRGLDVERGMGFSFHFPCSSAPLWIGHVGDATAEGGAAGKERCQLRGIIAAEGNDAEGVRPWDAT